MEQLEDNDGWETVVKPVKEKKKKDPESMEQKIYKKDDLCQMIKDVLTKYDPFGVFLYGSYAYGKATISSDVDLLIIWKKRIPANAIKIKEELIAVLQKHVDFVNMIYAGKMVEETNESNINFLNNVYEDCVPIVEQRCSILTSTLIGKLKYPKH
jgi:predicted nucleotidyltransferase